MRNSRDMRRSTTPADQLKALAGSYASDEAETKFVVALDGGTLVMKQRPDRVRTRIEGRLHERGGAGVVDLVDVRAAGERLDGRDVIAAQREILEAVVGDEGIRDLFTAHTDAERGCVARGNAHDGARLSLSAAMSPASSTIGPLEVLIR